MPVSNEEKEFTSYVVELMQSIGSVYAKRMFGGYGIFNDGLMFGLIADSVLYLKADEETVKEFKTKGLVPFSYHKQGKVCKLSYYQAPEEALENDEEMRTWATKAYNTALRAAAKKSKKK